MPVKKKSLDNLKSFEPGKSGNPNGRPKKGISLVNATLKEKGYDPANKKDIQETYLQMIQLSEVELKQLFADSKQPMLVKILAQNMTGKKNFDVIERMLDRGIGRSVQAVELDAKIEVSDNPI